MQHAARAPIECAILKRILQQCVLPEAVEDELPSIDEVAVAFKAAGAELSRRTGYEALRARDLLALAGILETGSDPDRCSVYKAALNALVRHRRNEAGRAYDLLPSDVIDTDGMLIKRTDSNVWFSHPNYAVIDPRCVNDAGFPSALGNAAPDQWADNAIVRGVLLHLVEDCRRPLVFRPPVGEVQHQHL